MNLRRYFLTLFLLFQILLLQIISWSPTIVEVVYSNGIYPSIGKFSRIIFGWIPFSLGDIIYFVLGFLVIKWFWKTRKSWRYNWKLNFIKIINVISVSYFLFHFLWAYNYYRFPLSEKLYLDREYSQEQLMAFSEKILEKTNAIHLKITNDSLKKVANPYTNAQIFAKAKNGFDNLAKLDSQYQFDYLSTKPSIISLPLSYMGFGGYINPFTNEAQVNYLIPKYQIAMTTTHEMAHQIGFASESEANFVGFLAVTQNDDLYFQYAGYSYVLRYCLSILAETDEKKFIDLKTKVNPGIFENYKENEDFVKKYESVVEDFFKIFYDNFLKMNQQDDGLIGYSRFINLLISYSEKNPL